MRIIIILVLYLFSFTSVFALDQTSREEKRKQEDQRIEEQFKWWPTDAQPAPVKDLNRGGYWWWPKRPSKATDSSKDLWGNRGYCYVRKIIFDYKSDELSAPKPQELRPSLLVKKIIRNVKIYFDYDKAGIRPDARNILENAIKLLNRNPESSILITGNCDIRGSEKYNLKLGRKRAESIKNFMFGEGIPEEKIRIVSRGKLDALAHVSDLLGMQKDRNAQFMVAEVEEIMLPYTGAEVPSEAKLSEDGKYIQEQNETVESQAEVATKEYVIKKGDTLSKIAKNECGKAGRWKYIYELNKDKIKNPDKLKVGQKIIIPIE